MNCPYCEIINKEYKNITTIYEDEDILAALLPEAVEGHIIVLPKQHETISIRIEEKIYNKMLYLSQKLAGVLKEASPFSSFNLISNMGAEQEVPHASLHILPRKQGDNIKISWETKQEEEAQLNEVADKLRGSNVNPMSKEEHKEKVHQETSDSFKEQIRRMP